MSSICYLEDSVGQYWGTALNEEDGSIGDADETLAQMLRSRMLSNMGTVLNVPHTDTHSVYKYMCDGYSIALEGNPVPPNTAWSLEPFKSGRASPGWGTSTYTGEICLTDYFKRTCSFEVSIRPIVRPVRSCDLMPRAVISAVPNVESRAASTLFSHFPYSKWTKSFIRIGGKTLSGSVDMRRKHGEVLDWGLPYNDVLNEKNLRSKFNRVYQDLKDPTFVQATVAEANERSMDLLTQIFELPETILSIGRSFLSVRSCIRNWQTREKLIQARKVAGTLGFDSKRRKLRDEIDFLIYELENYSGPRVRGMKSRLFKARKALKRLNKDRKSFLQKIGDELSSAWLRLRYEVLPTVYACQDLAESAENLSRLYQTERKRLVEDANVPEFPGWEFTGEQEVTWRCMVKYMYDTSGSLSDIRKAMSANAFLTAWELGKLTFVLDWFFSVGDMLSARFGKPDLVVDDGVTLSNKCKIRGVYTNKLTDGMVSVDYTHYQRQVIDPQDFLGIFPQINLNWKRLVDSSALLWTELRRHFK